MNKKIILILIMIMVMISCSKSVEKKETFVPGKLDYDEIQKLIISEYADKEHPGPFFCVYETLWIEEDSFYIRKYLFAFIEEIDENLNSDYSVTLPFVITVDKEKNKIVDILHTQINILIRKCFNRIFHVKSLLVSLMLVLMK